MLLWCQYKIYHILQVFKLLLLFFNTKVTYLNSIFHKMEKVIMQKELTRGCPEFVCSIFRWSPDWRFPAALPQVPDGCHEGGSTGPGNLTNTSAGSSLFNLTIRSVKSLNRLGQEHFKVTKHWYIFWNPSLYFNRFVNRALSTGSWGNLSMMYGIQQIY